LYPELGQERFGLEKKKRTFSPWNAYEYSVLPPGYIRLLRFKSNPIYSRWVVSFDLIHVPLNDPPSYKALSYRWSSKMARVSCGGGHLQVSANCKAALKRLNEEDRLLWVDAISINQGDDIERGHQVALMSQIYSHAEGTIAWLGEDADFGASCLADIDDAQRHFDGFEDISASSNIRDVRTLLIVSQQRSIMRLLESRGNV
jgi:Heterokaryon incompatibility protein (HET)